MIIKKIAKSIGIFFHKLGIWIVSFLLSTLLILLILTVFISFNNLMPSIAKGIYDYGDQGVKDNLTQKFDGLCDYFSSQIKLLEMQNKSVEEVKESMLSNSSASDEDKKNAEMVFKVAELCSEYQANKITFESLFINSVSTILTSQFTKSQSKGKENDTTQNVIKDIQEKDGIQQIVNLSRIVLPIIILFLFGLLYLLFIHKPKLYLRQLGKISIKVGITLIIPYLLIQGYVLFNPINTTPLLNLMSFGLSGGPLSQTQQSQTQEMLSMSQNMSQEDIATVQKETGITDLSEFSSLSEEDRQKILEKLKEQQEKSQEKDQQGKKLDEQSERELSTKESGITDKESGITNKEGELMKKESEGDTSEFAPDISKSELVSALAPLVLMHIYNLGLFIVGLVFIIIGILLLVFIKKEGLY